MRCMSTLTLRRVASGDQDFLLRLRNHPDIRKWSFNPNPVEPGEHARWFRTWLERPERLFFVPELDGAPIGYVRFEQRSASEWVISVATEPEFQRRGHTRQFVQESIRLCFSESGCGQVTAEVLPHNISARSLFEGLGFVARPTGEGQPSAMIRLELKK